MKTQLLKNTGKLMLILFCCALNVNAQGLLSDDPGMDIAGTDASSFSYRWYIGISSNNGTITRETTNPHGGASYAKATTIKTGQYYDFQMVNSQNLNSALIAGRTYRLSFYYKNSANHTFQVGLQDNNGAAPHDFFKIISTEATTWTLMTYEFIATEALRTTPSGTKVKFQFGKDIGTTEIDDIALEDITPSAPSANLIKNPSFEIGSANSFTNWGYYGNPNITASTSNSQDLARHVAANIPTKATNAYDTQLFTDNFTVIPGHNHYVSFWYKATKSFKLVFQKGGYYKEFTINSTGATINTWTKYETIWEFPLDRTETEMALIFHLSTNSPEPGTGVIELDNINLTDLSATLPVTLISFTAKSTLSSATLNWSTSSETNNNFYQILRAGDDKIFIPLYKQTAKNKAASYTFTDKSPLKGNNYYQLLQYDKNGEVTDLGVLPLYFNIEAKNNFTIYPNPATKQFSFQLNNPEDEMLQIQVSDLLGKTIINQSMPHKATDKVYTLQLPLGLNPGIYTVKVIGSKFTNSSKLIIN